MARTLGREVISTRQRKIAELAQREPKLTLTTLAHHVDDVWMREAYRRIRKDAAAGVDGVTAAQYEADLEANLSGLLERFKSGGYRAPAVRRVHLEKPGTSKTRPIGIPTLEDKILQRAVLMVLEPVYEQDFLDCSYGFRPGRGAHQALQSLWEGLMEFGGGWVIDLDIEDFFGSVDWGVDGDPKAPKSGEHKIWGLTFWIAVFLQSGSLTAGSLLPAMKASCVRGLRRVTRRAGAQRRSRRAA